ncbi:glycosyltransferase family 4 protein [Sphingomonas sp. C8-2]|jgi:glycosyltransferase involved in cell wall biosynthesis|nr:glycosyltransferase family 4 protein [Sphingomonas sp. C8-2]
MNKKMCFIVTDAISFNILYRGQLEYLVANGFNLTLICGGSQSELFKLRARRVGKVLDFGLVRQPNLWRDILSFFRILFHLIKNRYEVVSVSTPKAILLGSLAAYLTQQPRRLIFFQGRVYENFRGIRRFLYISFDKIAIFLSTETLFVSRSLMDEFSKEIRSVKKRGVLLGHGSGNGISIEAFSPSAVSHSRISNLRQSLGILSSQMVVIIVGRICRDKGINEIREVADFLSSIKSEIKLLFVGSVEDEESGAILKHLIASGIAIHAGSVDDVIPFFALADVHLFLSHREGFGNVAIEAAAMGVPTLAFDVVGISDSVSDGITGYRFPFGDTKAVANAIRSMQRRRDYVRRAFTRARPWVVERFAQEHVWRKYLEFYANGGERLQ